MKNQKFSINNRLKSFRFALNGLRILFKEEHNSRIHIVAAIFVVILGYIFTISPSEWIAITFAIGLVITLEILNSAIERISDFVSPEKAEKIGQIKDLAAAGVLISAITALVIGLIIFIPKLALV